MPDRRRHPEHSHNRGRAGGARGGRDAGEGAGDALTVDVERIHVGDGLFARVSTIGGEGEAHRPFVLVAGIGVASTYYERLAPRLREFGPVHALDLPGFAGVPNPPRALTIAQYADIVEKVLDRLGADDPILVGHSMGTQMVTEVAARRPDLSTIVLIGPVVAPQLRRLVPLGWAFLRSTWFEPLAVKVLALAAYVACGPRWFLRILPQMMRFRVEDRYADVRAHALVIRGENDYAVPRAWAEHVAASIELGTLWEVPTAGHSVMHAHAAGVASLCVAFAEDPHDTDGTLNRLSIAAAGVETMPYRTLGEMLRGFGGRITEAIGALRNDERQIAEGKTEHARAAGGADAE